ncbi:hypothetical protein [Nostoc sp. TCL26-01]|uniref:hypothetical protein n=1 Tax=Nostoc sp. TCL26-01 TaxID=2576904 RepID=UPI0015BF1B0A|nr:hypothetical protein [Nostoc sp. TCL26-01]QLE56442.1 hypothetical protein FD725_13510 [Nostoc sp. TCL26-01]
MADSLRVFRYSLSTALILKCLQIQLGVIGSIGICTLSPAKSQAAEPHHNEKSASALTEPATKINSLPAEQFSDITGEFPRQYLQVEESSLKSVLKTHALLRTENLELSKPSLYRLEPIPILMAAPENFNPDLRLPPVLPKLPENSSPPTTSPKPETPDAVLESIYTDYRYDTDNFGQTNLFIEPTVQFRLRNGNKIFIKTGFNFFEQRGVESIINYPLQVGWQGKIGQVTLQTAAGVDVFNRLPKAINFNAKVDTPISSPQLSPSGKLLSIVVLSANLEQGPYKSNARTLDNQITAWRFGPDLYWQIDRHTSLFLSLRLGNYNDGNSEVQTFSRLERKLGQFSLAANLFTWSYERDLERTSGYFSPLDFLVYNAELAWQGNITNFLSCRLAANLGRQRLKGEFDNANTYQTRCTVKLSPNLEADLGYSFSNVRNQDTGESAYTGNSLTGQMRVKF